MKFGKLAPREDPRTLRLSEYLAPGLPPPPPSFSALPRVEVGAKAKDPRKLFPMDGNDSKGCCTIAACAHAETVWEAYCSRKRVPSRRAVLGDYFRLTGGPDSGLVELDVLKHWRSEGITGEKILAFAQIDPGNLENVRQCVYLFGVACIGFTVQRDCIRDFNDGKPWTAGPLTKHGHAVVVVGYGPKAFQVLTWGGVQWGDISWFRECVDEVWCCLPGEAAVKEFSPGFDLDRLKADLAAIADAPPVTG